MDPAKIEQMSAEFEIHSTKALGEAKRAEANADNALAKAGDRAGFWNVVDKLFTHMEVPKQFRFANPTSSEDAVVNRCNPLDTPANSSMSGKELLAASTEKLEKLMGLVVQMDL